MCRLVLTFWVFAASVVLDMKRATTWRGHGGSKAQRGVTGFRWLTRLTSRSAGTETEQAGAGDGHYKHKIVDYGRLEG